MFVFDKYINHFQEILKLLQLRILFFHDGGANPGPSGDEPLWSNSFSYQFPKKKIKISIKKAKIIFPKNL